MPSNYDGPGSPGGGRDGELPPHLDPRQGRQGRSAQSGRSGGRSDGPARFAPGGLPPELDPRGRTRSARRRRSAGAASGVRVGLQIGAALISLAIVLGSGWAWATYRTFNNNLKRVNAITGGTSASKNNIDGSDQNILIVGNDDRDTATDKELAQLGTTRDGGSYNTDTMMLLHVPANGSKATVISFPRDSYVSIPGHGKNKLNAAYPIGVQSGTGTQDQKKAAGAQLLVQTIEDLTGLKVDHFVQVDLLGFYRISLAIGGVTVCMNNAVSEPNSGINLHKGNNVIEGTQALAFVRQRYGLQNGDLDRIKRQQYFLSAVFRKMTSGGTLLNPFKLQALLKAISSSIWVDDSMNLPQLAKQMQNLQAGNVKFTTIPTSGFADENIDGTTASTVAVNFSAMPEFIDSLIGTDAATALKNAKAAAPSTVTVTVVNDTNSNGLETANATALKALGFKTVIPPATSDVLDKTTIRYAPGQESAAKALQAQVPGAVMQRTAAVTALTLVLGNNGVQVKSLMPVTTKPTTPSSSAPPTTSAGVGGTTVTTAADTGCIN